MAAGHFERYNGGGGARSTRCAIRHREDKGKAVDVVADGMVIGGTDRMGVY